MAHDIVIDGSRVKVHEIANKINVSNEWVLNILHEYLGMKKLSTRKVLPLLIEDQKQNCTTILNKCLDKFERKSSKFLLHYVTAGETWMHY